MNKTEQVSNRSTTYILPLLSDNIYIENSTVSNSIISTYLEVYGYKDIIVLLCDYLNNNTEYEKFEKSVFESELFIKKYEIGNKVAYLLEFPKLYLKEYLLFKEGKYSKFGDDCKLKIIRFWNKVLGKNYKFVPVIKKIKQILYKDQKLNAKMQRELKVFIDPNNELGEAYNREREEFNLKEIKVGE